MNGLKIRKLATVVAGAALLGAAIAPAVSAVTSADAKSIIYNADMSPVVNIVVGQNAHVSDGAWAGNVARAIVEKAVLEKAATGTGTGGSASVSGLAATLAIGGTVTVTGGKTFNSATLNSVSSTAEYEQEINKDPLTFLKDETLSYKFNGSNYDITLKERVGVSLNAKFDQDKDLKDLVANIDAGDINYTLDLGAGIPIGSTAAATADFEDTSDDNIRIPFFGKNYLVQRVDIDSSRDVSEVRLIEDKAKQTFVAGDSFTMTGKGQYDGQTLTVTIVSVVATSGAGSYEAKINLTDESGNLIDTQNSSAGAFVTFEDSDGDEVVSGDLYLDSVAVNTGTNEGTVDLLVGTSSVRLKDGENYPYSEDVDSENLNGPYLVSITNTTDTNKLTKIVIKNRAKSTISGTPDTAPETLVDSWPDSIFDDDNPLRAKNGHLNSALDDAPYSFTWLEGTGALGEGFFSVTFNGLQQDEENTYLKFAENELTFRDASDSQHVIPYWMSEGETDTTGSQTGLQFGFDNGNKTIYYDVNMSTNDFNVVDGTFLNGVATDLNGTGGIQTDQGWIDINAATPSTVTINGVTYTVLNAAGSTTSVKLRADGYIKLAKATLNSSTATSDYLTGLAGATNVTGTGEVGDLTTSELANAFFYDDANANGVSTAGIKFPLSGDSYYAAYAYQVIEGDGAIAGSSTNGEEGVYFYLLGDTNAATTNGTNTSVVNANAATGFNVTIPYGSTLQNSKRLALVGTDTGKDNTADRPYYYPQNNDVGQDSSSTTIFVANFAIDENNSSVYPAKVYIDTQTDSIPDLDDDDLALPTSDVNYGYSGSGINGQTFQLSNKAIDTALLAAYSDWGSKYVVNNNVVEVWMPQNRPEVEFIVSGASSTTTVEGGEEITVKEGETGEFSTGTKITVSDIAYTADVSGGTTGDGTTYLQPAPLNGKAQVYTTASSVPGPKIIVGGPLVNSLAQEVSGALNAPGDWVSGVYGSNIIVAGYTADDTAAAAQDLINAIEGL